MNLQEKVFNALTAILNNIRVVKYENEYNGDYPVAVFDEIENVPAIFADNVELLKKITYKVSIGTENDCYEDIENAVELAMKNLGFNMRALAIAILCFSPPDKLDTFSFIL